LNEKQKIDLTIPNSSEMFTYVIDFFVGITEKKIVELESVPESFITEIKILLSELLSNVSKHNESSFLKIVFSLDDAELSIMIVTEGSGFKLKPVSKNFSNDEYYKDTISTPPFASEMIGNSFMVYIDQDFKVLCNVQSENFLNFTLEKISNIKLNLNHIPEHFGLLLLTRLSDEVLYRRESDDLNYFIIKKKYRLIN